LTIPEQPSAPYLDAVVAYGFRGPGRFHVPGHKGGEGADPGLRHAIGDNALLIDIPQDIHGIDLGPEPTPYQQAEQLAAEAHGAERTWFLTNGATQGNHALALALAPLGARVVAQRNSHASLVDGLVLSGGIPSFVAPEYDDELGMAHGVTPEALAAALDATDGVRAAFIVSPTYYGMAADVEGCAAVCHERDVPLVVDQAWGPHFGFHPDLPPSALAQGADAVLTSTHKIVGSLTQSAMLHVAPTGRVDVAAVGRAMRLVRSTSPSALLMASLDGARRQLAIHGEALLHEAIAAAGRTRARMAKIPGIALVDLRQRTRQAWQSLRDEARQEIRDFVSALRACTEGSLAGTDDAGYSEAKFVQVKQIIDRFRGREGFSELDKRWTAKVTDVRQLFTFSASDPVLFVKTADGWKLDSAGSVGDQACTTQSVPG
jgi:lysine decarboxylase